MNRFFSSQSGMYGDQYTGGRLNDLRYPEVQPAAQTPTAPTTQTPAGKSATMQNVGVIGGLAGVAGNAAGGEAGGAIGGAGQGAAMGSAAGPWGAAAGAAVGLTAGILSSRRARKQRAAEAQARAQENIANIEMQKGQMQQQAFANILAGLRSALTGGR